VSEKQKRQWGVTYQARNSNSDGTAALTADSTIAGMNDFPALLSACATAAKIPAKHPPRTCRTTSIKDKGEKM